jgi:hypothetical protein
MLASPGTEPVVVVPALELLKTAAAPAGKTTPAGKKTVAVDHAVAAVERLLLAEGPTVSGFTFKEAVGGVVRIRLADLPDQRAFMVEGDTLAISKGGIERLCALSDDGEAQRALAVLYTLHEVVHGFQGAAGMGRVAELRFAGAESALMHIDLGADHVAAVIANAIFPTWDLLWLKDWQGQSIRGFPASARNPAYSRIRKTLRLVGLRVDLALRKLGVGSEHMTRESYGFGDFSPSGGAFIALVNRPPFVVVKTSTINPGEASVLFEGIEGEDGSIERVDEVVVEALRKQ